MKFRSVKFIYSIINKVSNVHFKQFYSLTILFLFTKRIALQLEMYKYCSKRFFNNEVKIFASQKLTWTEMRPPPLSSCCGSFCDYCAETLTGSFQQKMLSYQGVPRPILDLTGL